MIKITKELLEFKRPSPHSKFSPSASDRWIACPYSIKATEGIPESTSKYAEEGTLAHEICEHIFRERVYGIPTPIDAQMRLALLPDGGEEMEDCAEQYVDLLEAWLKLPELGDILWYGEERGIPIFPEEGCFGTGDFTIVGTKGCAVIDFKYGKGKEVKKGSLQLKAYALGIYRHLTNIPKDYEFNAVVFQPRINMIPKVDIYSVDEMVSFEAEVIAAIDESKKEGLTPLEGSHCFWCPAKRTNDPNLKCSAIKQKTLDVANQNFNEFFNDMNLQKNVDSELDKKRDAALIKIMSLAPLLTKMAADAKDELAFRLQQGEAIPGVVLRDKKAIEDGELVM